MRFLTAGLLAGFAFAAIGQTAVAADITGAGATFPAPAYAAWGDAYKAKTGNSLNYQGIGSGGGVTQISNRTVDFGASDAPVPQADLDKNKLLQFPAVIGSLVATFNLAGVTELNLSGPVLADIYQGKIKTWNDAKIAALNPNVKLPATAIVPVYRSDASGTSFVYTSYLAEVSPSWKSEVGAATSVQWPAGAGAKGNDGVAATVKNTAGAIGYVEFVYAASNKLNMASLQNKAGKTIKPTEASFAAAAGQAKWADAKDLAPSMLNLDGDNTWPIVSATYILLPTNPTDAARSAEVMKFFDWAFKEGGAAAEKLHYIPLPASVTDTVRAAWKAKVKSSDGKNLWN
jgi:phosphate transport system substrate-binding protein